MMIMIKNLIDRYHHDDNDKKKSVEKHNLSISSGNVEKNAIIIDINCKPN